jgi:ankyrin repeat protein
MVSGNGHAEVVREMLHCCFWVNVNATDLHGSTALILASKNGRDRVVCELLKHDTIDAGARGKRFGNTALMEACANGHTAVVHMLLMHVDERNVNAKDTRFGCTALMLASATGQAEVVRELLLDDRVATNAVSDLGETAFHLACSHGQPDVVHQYF